MASSHSNTQLNDVLNAILDSLNTLNSYNRRSHNQGSTSTQFFSEFNSSNFSENRIDSNLHGINQRIDDVRSGRGRIEDKIHLDRLRAEKDFYERLDKIRRDGLKIEEHYNKVEEQLAKKKSKSATRIEKLNKEKDNFNRKIDEHRTTINNRNRTISALRINERDPDLTNDQRKTIQDDIRKYSKEISALNNEISNLEDLRDRADRRIENEKREEKRIESERKRNRKERSEAIARTDAEVRNEVNKKHNEQEKEQLANAAFRTIGLGKFAEAREKVSSLQLAGETFEALNIPGAGMLKGFSKILGKFTTGPFALFTLGVQLAGDALKSLAETSYKLHDIQNKRSTLLTQLNIDLSSLDVESKLANFTTEFNKGFMEIQTVSQLALQKMAIENSKYIAANQSKINMAVGNVNDAAWEALAARTDIEAQQAKYNVDEKAQMRILGLKQDLADTKNISTQANIAEQMVSKIVDATEQNSQLYQSEIETAQQNSKTYLAVRASGVSTEAPDEKVGKINGNDVSRNLGKYGSTFGPNSIAGVGVANSMTAGIFGLDNVQSAMSIYARQQMEDQAVTAKNQQTASEAQVKLTGQIRDTVADASTQISESVTNTMAEIEKSTIDTNTTIKKQYQQMARTIENWALNFQKLSITSGYGKGITDKSQLVAYEKFMHNTTEIVSRKYGLKAEDILNIQNQLHQGTGRTKIAGTDEIENIASLDYYMGENGIGAQLASNTEIFNTSIEDSIDSMFTMIKQINKIGLDSRKYTKDMLKNLQMAQKYDFKKGIQGLFDMSKWAQNVRFNMNSLPQILENIQEGGLENIITKGARLQVLGGKFAMGADPLAMLFEGFNAPEDLMLRYNDMLRGLGRLNSVTGKVDFNMEEQLLMRNFAKATGQDLTDVRNQASYLIKNEKLNHLIDTNLDEDQRNLLINASYMDKKTGKWRVRGLNGEEMSLNSINSSNIDKIQPINDDDLMRKSIEKTVAWQDKIAGLQESNNAYLAIMAVGPEFLKEQMEKRIATSDENMKENSEFYTKEIQKNMDAASDSLVRALEDQLTPEQIQAETVKNINNSVSNIRDILSRIALEKFGNGKFQFDAAEVSEKSEDAKIKINDKFYSTEKLMSLGLITGRDENGNPLFDNKIMTSTFGNNWYSTMGRTETSDTKKMINSKFNTGTHFKVLETFQNYQQRLNNGEDVYSIINEMSNTYDSFRKQLDNGNVTSGVMRQLDAMKSAIDKLKSENEVLPETPNGKNARKNADDIMPKSSGSFSSVRDGVLSSNGSSMFTQASSITPINDGSVQLAKSDPKDTALFAKTGGPFDTLFNNIFTKINEIDAFIKANVGGVNEGNIQPKSMPYIMPEEPINFNGYGNSNEGASINRDSKLQIEPLKIEINGKLELSGGNGNDIDIMKELQSNPILLRSLVQMISENINQSINGGKSSNALGITTPRFNTLNF